MSALLVGYARCSTDQQDLTAQRDGLFGLGVEADRIYVDHGLTGTTHERPGLREALAACRSPGRSRSTSPTFVMAANGRYYAFDTGGGTDCQSLVGLVSQDLVSWQPFGPRPRPGGLPAPATHLWAPEVAQIDGEFGLYYSAGVSDKDHRLRAAVSSRPEGPYRQLQADLAPSEPLRSTRPRSRTPTAPGTCSTRSTGWTPSASVRPIVVDRMLGPDRLAGDARPVVSPSADWQLFLPDRPMYGGSHDWHTCEGPFVVQRGGRYWCLYSGGNWQQPSYGVSAASAYCPLGPWTEEPGNEPSVIRTRPGAVHGPGHASVVADAAGNDWLVYHAWDPDGTARRMFLDRLRWTAHGPVCDGPTTTAQVAPHVPDMG